jgi:hypothetical protein
MCCSFPAFSTPFMGHVVVIVVDIMYVALQILSDDRAMLKQQHVHCRRFDSTFPSLSSSYIVE